MSKRKRYDYKSIHVKKELHSELDQMRRAFGFTSFSELFVYLIDRERGTGARKNNCNCQW